MISTSKNIGLHLFSPWASFHQCFLVSNVVAQHAHYNNARFSAPTCRAKRQCHLYKKTNSVKGRRSSSNNGEWRRKDTITRPPNEKSLLNPSLVSADLFFSMEWIHSLDSPKKQQQQQCQREGRSSSKQWRVATYNTHHPSTA